MVHTVDEQRNYCSSPQPAGSRTKCGPGVFPAPCLRLYIDLFNISSSILCVFYRLVFFFPLLVSQSHCADHIVPHNFRKSYKHDSLAGTAISPLFSTFSIPFIEKVIPFLPSDVIGF